MVPVGTWYAEAAHRILAIDPGATDSTYKEDGSLSVNGSFAYALLADGVLARYGTVKPVTNLKDGFAEDAAAFTMRIQGLVRACHLRPTDCVVAERFQDRGGASKGTTSEQVNIMLGIMAGAVSPCSLQLVTPSTWKGWLARTYKIGKPGARQQTETRNMMTHLVSKHPKVFRPKGKAHRMVVHEGDACGIGLWQYETSAPQERQGALDLLVGRSVTKISV